MDVDWWDAPVALRRGSPKRLRGLDIFYDFVWEHYFPDRRAQFRNGLWLARLAERDCPPDKRPGLLLTDRDDVEQVPIRTDSHFLVVVNLPRYLREASVDPAAAYYAHEVEGNITDLARLHELAQEPDVIRAVLDQHLDGARIAAWAKGNEDRLDQLRAIAALEHPASPPAPVGTAISALRTLEELDPDIVTALEAILGKVSDRETRLTFLKALTSDRAGRYATSEVLGDRISDRLADAESAAAEYGRLLADTAPTETDLQKHIEEHPWLVGLEYVQVRPRSQVPRGTLDFILERYDGSHDLLELKDPHDPIIVAPQAAGDGPPSASRYSLSPALAQAMAQVHVYRDILTEHASTIESLYGIKNTRYPHVIIVIGEARRVPEHRLKVMRELNLSLHRVEVVPYDVLGERARTQLKNVRAYMTHSDRAP